MLMASTILSSRGQSYKFKHFMRLLDKTVIPHNGPSPLLARNKEDTTSLPSTGGLKPVPPARDDPPRALEVSRCH